MSIRTCAILILVLTIGVAGCAKKGRDGATRSTSPAVVAVEGDIDSFNPLFAEDITAGEINDLLFPGLVGSTFDTTKGMLQYTPLLARGWEFQNGHKDLIFHLKPGVQWSDGRPVTARDVQSSYRLYGDPAVGSVRQTAVQNLRTWQGQPDIMRSVEVKDDTTVVFHFARPSPSQLFDAGLPILPSHILDTIPPDQLRSHQFNRAPVVSGPFVLKQWTPLEGVTLASNPASTVPSAARLALLVFRVIPDYQTRISQLKTGEDDIVAGLKPEDVATFSGPNSTVRIISTPGRDYDFLGWNNIDPNAYGASEGKSIRPHPLFGSARVRRALTMGIDREQIVKAYLAGYGRVAIGGISPIFRWAYNDTLRPLPFDPKSAAALLEQEGWRDDDGDGVLEKGGMKFAFSLKIPTGNQMRVAIATVVQQELRAIKIDMKIEQVERGTFWDNLLARKYDAFFAGFSVPLQLQLDDLWGSDLAKYPFNVTGFRNPRVDAILAASKNFANEEESGPLWKEFQCIINDQQPCTLLYWVDQITGINNRIEDTHIGIMGTMQQAWDWHLEGDDHEVSAK